jgi:hypothetical protein
MSLGSFIYVLDEINKKEVQNELDIDVQQLDSVASQGNGASSPNGATSHERPLRPFS